MVPLVLLLLIPPACLAAPVSIADAKKLADGAPVELVDKIVTAVFPGCFYVSEADHSGGLRVVASVVPLLQSTAAVSGTMATNSSRERQLIASTTSFRSFAPTRVSNKEIGGDAFHYDAQTGAGQCGVPLAAGMPNNIGELVQTTGTVMMGKPGDSAGFPIDDGTNAALLVVVAPGVTNPGYGAQVTVTGISSLQDVNGTLRRAILLRGPQDLEVTQPAPECKYTDDMIYIPAGAFDMGTDTTDTSFFHCRPMHKVHMDGYWIGKHEVTRAQFRLFMESGAYSDPQYWSEEGWWWRTQFRTTEPAYWTDAYWPQTESHPVVGVSPYEMDAYCKWAGVRRTTEAEWEKAAAWDPEAQRSRAFPWGDEWDVDKCNNHDDAVWILALKTAPVGTYPTGASYYGCLDMAGNVFEWCRGFYTREWYRVVPALGWINPQGEVRPEYDFYNTEAYRGGSWYALETDMRCAWRFGQIHTLYNADIGFRVAR